MAKQNFKYNRLAEEIRAALGQVIAEEVEGLEFVSIYQVELTKDLGDAKVFVQTIDETDEEKILEKLNRVKPFLKKRLAEEVKMRRIPNLLFKFDHSLDNYNRIDKLIRDL